VGLLALSVASLLTFFLGILDFSTFVIPIIRSRNLLK
jgi:hypothetical protein